MIWLNLQQGSRPKRQPYYPLVVVIEYDFAEYLSQLREFRGLHRFGEVPHYGSSWIDRSWLEEMIADTENLLPRLLESSDAMDIPEDVGLTSDEDEVRRLGKSGFRTWLLELHLLATMALQEGNRLQCAGN